MSNAKARPTAEQVANARQKLSSQFVQMGIRAMCTPDEWDAFLTLLRATEPPTESETHVVATRIANALENNSFDDIVHAQVEAAEHFCGKVV